MKPNWKKNTLRIASIFLVTILGLQVLFLPVSANVNTEQEGETLQIQQNSPENPQGNEEEIRPTQVKQISDDVEIVELCFRDIERLLDKTGDITFDGFGDKDTYEEARAREEAGVSNTPGVENATDQFITTNEGETVMLYDLLEHRAIRPDDVPHLSHMVTSGHMSYTTLLDETTRVCPEYPDETCERGHVNPEEAQELQEKLEEKEAEVSQIADLAEEGLHEAITPFIDAGGRLGIIDEVNDTEEYLREGEEDIEELKEKLDGTPLNVIQSNYSISHLQRPDSLMMFPHHLGKFIQYLETLESRDQVYAVAQGASMITSIASIKSSIKGARLARAKLDAIDSKEDVLSMKAKSSKIKSEITQEKGNLKNKMRGPIEQEYDNKNVESITIQDGGDSGTVVFDDDTWVDISANDMDNMGIKSEANRIGQELNPAEANMDEISDAVDESFHNGEISVDQFKNEIMGRDLEDSIGDIGRYEMSGGDTARMIGDKMDSWQQSMAIGEAFKEGGLSLGGFAVGAGRTFKHSVRMMEGFLTLSFIPMAFYGAPEPAFQLMGLSIEAEPDRVIEDKDAYFEMARATERSYGQDFYPAGTFDNLMDFFGVDMNEIMPPDDAEVVRRKVQEDPGPGYVKIIDQETSAETYTDQPVNMIHPQRIGDMTGERWMIQSINPTMTDYQAFEHPKSYAEGNDKFFSTMSLIVKDLDLAGLTTMEQDWAQQRGDWLVDYTPTTRTMFLGSLAAGGVGGITAGGLFTGSRTVSALKATMGYFFARGIASLGEDEAKRIQETEYGKLVDVGEAYREGDPCGQELEELRDGIEDTRRWMWGGLVGDTTFDIASLAAKRSAVVTAKAPYAAPAVLAGMSIAASLAKYWGTRQYQQLRTDGLERMKDCQETMFELLAFSEMPTEDARSEDLLEQIKGDLGEGLAGIPGLESIAPEATEELRNLGPQYYENIMALSGKIEGESMVNLFGTELYQVHFDRESDIKWFLEEHQDIEFCEEVDRTPEGKPIFQCMVAEGYTLLDFEGNPILDAPQTTGIRWDNDRELMTIPQRVINVKHGPDQLMEIEKDEVRIDDQNAREAVRDVVGRRPPSNIFGDLQTINTENAVLWHDGDTTVARFTDPVKDHIGRGQVLRFDDTHIQMYKNNEIEIQRNTDNEPALNYTFEVGESGFLSFENGKITPGMEGEQEVRANNATMERDFSEWNHIIIYDLLSFTADRAESYEIQEGCLEDEEPEFGGMSLGGEFNLPEVEEEQAKELLGGFCNLNRIDGAQDQTITVRDNELCWEDPQGEVVCREIDEVRDGRIHFEDGYSLDVSPGPDGEPEFQFLDPDGEAVGPPIPLLRASGPGGMMGYDPETGEISISNEFPFQMNPEFGDIGAGMTNPGMVVPQQSEFGGRPPEPDVDVPVEERDPGLLAELPSTPGRESQLEEEGEILQLEEDESTVLPLNQVLLIIFIVTILGGIVAIRRNN